MLPTIPLLPSKTKTAMKERVPITAKDGLFRGLANHNMLFHQCICELIDNSIAAKKEDIPFRVDVIFDRAANGVLWVYIVDNSQGMTKAELRDALQIGVVSKSNNRLNEHGYGLKNALATLTSAEGDWKVYSRDYNTNKISSVSSPYSDPLWLEDDDAFPELPYEFKDASTIIMAEVKISYIQDVQERGAKTQDLDKLRLWLLEHLGVIYRAYLLPYKNKNAKWSVDGEINVAIHNNVILVNPIEIPLGVTKHKDFDVSIGGKVYTLHYMWGEIDEEKANQIVIGNETSFGKLKAYYKQNQATQGIDIRIGKRVIATKVLEPIWHKKTHNDYNDFSGELVIPDTIPKGVLKTVTTKTDFKQDDPDWRAIFDTMEEKFELIKNPKSKTEEEFKTKLEAHITSLSSNKHLDIITREKAVWPMGVKIDVYWKKYKTGETIIFEVKTQTATALDLYQLKMYWDGLVEQAEHPDEGWLVCNEYKTPLVEMMKILNTLRPKDGFENYNFSLRTIKEMHLM